MIHKLFKRKVDVITNGLTFTNDNLDIEFSIPFDDDLDPNLSEITIYNLSESSRNLLKKGQKLSINAGYEGDKGVVLSGNIEYVTTTKTGADRSTLIKVLDSVPADVDKKASIAFKNGIKSDQIIIQLSQLIGLKIAVLKLPNNKVFEKGHTVNGEALKEIQKIAEDCGASSYISRSQVYIRPLTDGDNTSFILNSDTGLIGSPDYFEEEKNGKTVKGYKLKCLLQYRMNTGSIIKLDSVEAQATLRVRKGKHTSSGSSYYTEVEAIL